MTQSLVTTASLMFCWMYSPDALVIVGNVAGTGGWYSLLAFIFALLIAVWTVAATGGSGDSVDNAGTSQFTKGLTSDTSGLFSSSFITLVLSIGTWMSLCIFIPTGALVTAGFSFNETFVYWFPNFGFSFLLLAIILLAHLKSEGLPLIIQVVFFSITAGGLVLLVFIGLFFGSHQTQVNPGAYPPGTELPGIQSLLLLFCTAPLLLVGCGETINRDNFRNPGRQKLVLLVASLFIICCWAAVSLLHVDQEKLAHSTIPYILGAREAAGQTGRVIMGLVVICGSCSVVNGFLILAFNAISQISRKLYQPLPYSTLTQKRVFALLTTTIVGILMATGLAGEDRLETYIYGSLLLWLLFNASTALNHLFSVRHNTSKIFQRTSLHRFLPPLLISSFIVLIINAEDFNTLVRFLVSVLMVATSLALWRMYYDRSLTKPTIKQSQGDLL